MPKRIESDFPFSQLSLIAERESWRKEIYRPVYYLHKWWARRLGSVFRGILLGACLDESEDFWQRYYSANDFGANVVFDCPFMGSGVTVGEAIKLGCRVVGRDINQVAYLSCHAALSKYSPDEVLSTFSTTGGGSGPCVAFLLYDQNQGGKRGHCTLLLSCKDCSVSAVQPRDRPFYDTDFLSECSSAKGSYGQKYLSWLRRGELNDIRRRCCVLPGV